MSQEAKNILKKLGNQEKIINYRKLYFKGGKISEYDFTDYRPLLAFFKAIYYRSINIEEAEAIQEEFNDVYGALEIYKPIKKPYIEKRRKFLINANNFYKGREMIIDAFKNEVFPMVPTGFSEDEEPSESRDEEEKDGRLRTIKEEEEALEKIAVDDLLEPALVKKYFKNDSLTDMFEQFRYRVKNQSKISAKKIKMTLIEAGLEKLKSYMRNMTENEIKNKKLDVLPNFIEEVLIGDRMNDMPPLESEEDAVQRQQGQGLKIMTPKQMITRLPILLAQLKAGNNSQKLKNEIRHIVYSLYRSKNLSKTIYNHLISTI